MLKNKRTSNKTNATKKQIKTNEKGTNKKDKLNLIEDVNDEEILSESSVDSEEIDKQQQKQGKNKVKEVVEEKSLFKQNMSADEKRLIMAKTLINTIESQSKDNLDNDFNHELKKSKQETCEEKSKYLKLSQETLDHSFVRCHLSTITSVNFIDSSKIITTSKDGRSFIIDVNTEQKTILPEFSQKPLLCASLTNNKKNVLFAGNDRKIYLFNLESNKIISVLSKAHQDAITGIKVDTDNEQVYSVSKDNNMKVWAMNDFNNLVYMETFYGHTNSIWDIDALSSNRILTCGNDSNIHHWKIDAQSFLQYKQGASQYDCISAVNKNYFYSGDYDGKLKLFSIEKKKALADILNYNGNLKDLTEVHCPILSIHAIRNSDLCLTGSINGNINVFKANYSKNINQIENLGRVNILNNGIVSCLSSNDKLLIAGISKDAKNGRWDVDNSLKHSGVAIVKIFE